jgi:hypothetical protein
MNSSAPTRDALNRLFVEGADDFHVVCALVRRDGVDWSNHDPRIPYSPRTSGDHDAIRQAEVASRLPGVTIGLVIDADDNAGQRWASVKHAFNNSEQYGLNLPDDYLPEGVVTSGSDGRRLGIWMMPYELQPGAVEDLLISLVPPGPLWDHAVASTDGACVLGAQLPGRKLTKAQLRAWLAWQNEPGSPYGRAIEQNLLSGRSQHSDTLAAWFRRLYLAGP